MLLVSLSGYADLLRSGDISYQAVPGQPNTYLITFTIYTNCNPGIPDDLNTLLVNLGDSTKPTLQRQNGLAGMNSQVPSIFCNHLGEIYSPGIRKNIFTITHTYSANHSFTISTAPIFRNAGILNFTGYSGGYPLYLEAMLTTGLPLMNSPEIMFPPIDNGCLGYVYKLFSGAADPDGDILNYQLIRCLTNNGVNIAGYKFPNELDPTSTFTMDSRTGLILWDKPKTLGEYNIALRIEKYRKGVLVGYIVRDIQVTIQQCQNAPPAIDPIPNICVPAGTPITYKVTSSDPNNDALTFEYSGPPFQTAQNPATFTPDNMPQGMTSGTFTWNTLPSHFARTSYAVYYRVTDKHPGTPSLSDIVANIITLTVPPVKNVIATPFQRGFNVRWDKSVTPDAIGYNIYRKTGPNSFSFDSCMLGIPFTSGFTLVGTVNSQNTLSFTDNNNGKGLTSGYSYCYVVTALFDGGAENPPSKPYCTSLSTPFIRVIQDTISQCVGTTVVIDSSIIVFDNADAKTTYKWTTTPAQLITNANKQVPTVKMNTTGFTYIKVVSKSGVSADSATLCFNTPPIPTPHINVVDVGGMPDSVFFFNQSVNAVSAQWLLPDGTVSTSMDSVLCVFDKNGFYRVKLKVYNSVGCSDTISKLYRVIMKGLSMPNAFEPENTNPLDTHKDLRTFKPKALGLGSFYMGIWDLWGNLIWSTDKVNQYQEPLEGWDGNDRRGRKMPSQSYIWRMNATFFDGTVWKGVKDHFGKYHKEGTFTLLR